jgi:DNA-binding GntR family transcriptional regulator
MTISSFLVGSWFNDDEDVGDISRSNAEFHRKLYQILKNKSIKNRQNSIHLEKTKSQW